MSGSDETFSQSMTSEQLITWLHQQLEEKYKDDIIALTDIFKKNHVDGEMFLELTDGDLKGDPFNVESWGLRKKIMKLVEQHKGVESPKPKEKPVLLTSWCSYKVSGTPEEPREPIKDGAQPAVMDPHAKLWHHDPLLIKFKSPELLEGWKITAKQILLWACKWRHDKHNHIPSFRLAEKNDNPDIIIELNMGGNNSSLCGRTTKDTTMWLDLSSDNYRYNEHLVVHEFGHALGLGHEHQRSDFCIFVAPFLDESKMKKDLGTRFDHWKADFKLDTSGGKATPYDCHSVMHYWFKTEWLKHGYDNKKKIEDAFHGCQLTEKQRDALLGVHMRAGLVPIEPSQQDLDFVNHMYGKSKVVTDNDDPEEIASNGQDAPISGAPALPETPTNTMAAKTGNEQDIHPATPTTTAATEKLDFSGLVEVSHGLLDQIKWKNANGKIETVYIYKAAAMKWKKVATVLGLEEYEIEGIDSEKRGKHEDCVIAVFSRWLQNASGMKYPEKFPKSWKGLINLLNESERAELAKSVIKAISSPQNEAKKNL